MDNLQVINGWVNLTEGPVNVNDILLPKQPEAKPARLFKSLGTQVDLNGIPTIDVKVVGPLNLPEPQNGTKFLVPFTIAVALQGERSDVYYPDAIIKKEDGVTYCRRASRYIPAAICTI